MKKIHWIKQLTRENSLLDRSLRTIAYHRSVREIGRASISTVLIVGSGPVNSFYYSAEDYTHQRRVIAQEFSGQRIGSMSNRLIRFLEDGYRWSLAARKLKLTKRDFHGFFTTFNHHHAHARGAVTYGYWGEPTITRRLRRQLREHISPAKLDYTVSILSGPKYINGLLQKLLHANANIETRRQLLSKKLGLPNKTMKNVEILSWLTLFYELGERVACHIYDTFLIQLKRLIKNRAEYSTMAWYDPRSIKQYFFGRFLPGKEIKRRQDFYVVEMVAGRWRLWSGTRARQYYAKIFPKSALKHFNTTIIKGMTAQPGQATGTVKIVMTRADLQKMKAGGILVAPMTTVRMMTAIQKAAAIVTDEGGMTAHAAIVAREFKIPCIVGTKNATQILKDGDRVSVDATRGIVRKL